MSLGMHALLRLRPDLGAIIFDIAFCEIAFKKDEMAFIVLFKVFQQTLIISLNSSLDRGNFTIPAVYSEQ